jgi:hypothetical protein
MREPNHRIEEADAPALLATASDCLSRRMGTLVRLTWQERIRDYPHVLRCAVETGAGVDLPATIILKSPQRASRLARLMNDAAGLDFLNRIADGKPDTCPRFFGADPVGGFMLSEDLGPETLTPVLLADGPDSHVEATAALLSLARTLAEVAVATGDRAAEYDSLRAAYGEREPHMNFDCAGHLTQSFDELTGCLASFDIPLPNEFGHDYADLCELLAAPAPFLAYTVFDNSPGNTIWSREMGRARVFDFDHGAYRMMLLDGACPRLMQTYPDVFSIPSTITDQMEAIYRHTLATAFPETEDDRLWERAMAGACAFWTIYYVIGYLPRILDGTLAEDFLWPKRQILKVLRELSRAPGAFQNLRVAADALQGTVYARWRAIHGEEALAIRPFPALDAR